jgi:hypothetical protein
LEGIDTTVQDSLFDGNMVLNDGGGLYLYGTSVVERSRVLRNIADYEGGGMLLLDNPTIRNTAIVDNIVNRSDGTGSGILIGESTSTATLQQVTISHNTGGDGTGVKVAGRPDTGGPGTATGGAVTMDNMIIANQDAGVCVVNLSKASVAIHGVLWYKNLKGIYNNNVGLYTTGCGNWPSVTSPLSGDPAFFLDGYHISRTSAALDKGLTLSTITDDLDGGPRPQFGGYDLGADEMDYFIWLPLAIRQ